MTREEAIEVYNDLINQKIKEAFEFFAPELKESKDERTRKALIETINCLARGDTQFMSEDTRQRYLAYLEKQKEQNLELYYDKELDNAAREFYLSGGADSPVDSTGLVPIVRMAEFGATWMKERMEKGRKPADDRYMEGYNKGYKDAEEAYNKAVSYHFPTVTVRPLCWEPGGTCTNPHMDCINCPRKTTGGFNTAYGTSTATLHGNTSATDGKEHNPSFTD